MRLPQIHQIHDYFSGFRIRTIEHTQTLKQADRIFEDLAKAVLYQAGLPETHDRGSTINQIYMSALPQITAITNSAIVFESLDRSRLLASQGGEAETILKYILQALYMTKLEVNLSHQGEQ
jgi:hypothetical protein